MMPHVLAHGQSISPTRRQINTPDTGSTSQSDRRDITARSLGNLVQRLSPAMRRLLLEGDVRGRYAGINEADAGYRVTMALAVAASQPGRQWCPADFHHALIYTPTEAGEWARSLRARKGTEYAEGKLTGMLLKAREFVGDSPAITCRQSAWESVEAVRSDVDQFEFSGRSGGMDLKNVTARLRICERAGGLEHSVSVRSLADEMNCSSGAVERSNKRLTDRGILKLVHSGAGSVKASVWELRSPVVAEEERAQRGHLPSAEAGGGRSPVPVTRNDTRGLARIMNHDAFHHYGHGPNGARILSLLDVHEGRSHESLRDALGVHRSTVLRRLEPLLEDGLVTELEGLYYLAEELSGEDGVQREEETLAEVAEKRGTTGAGERRRKRHHQQRLFYRAWRRFKEFRQAARQKAEVECLVPEGVVDRVTGEILDSQWQQWGVVDVSQPLILPDWAVRQVPQLEAVA